MRKRSVNVLDIDKEIELKGKKKRLSCVDKEL